MRFLKSFYFCSDLNFPISEPVKSITAPFLYLLTKFFNSFSIFYFFSCRSFLAASFSSFFGFWTTTFFALFFFFRSCSAIYFSFSSAYFFSISAHIFFIISILFCCSSMLIALLEFSTIFSSTWGSSFYSIPDDWLTFLSSALSEAEISLERCSD